MTIRFLRSVESVRSGLTFQPGQEIRVAGLTPEVRRWLQDGRAELVRDQPRETAVAGRYERATA